MSFTCDETIHPVFNFPVSLRDRMYVHVSFIVSQFFTDVQQLEQVRFINHLSEFLRELVIGIN